jgi:hypothetical protein
MFLSSWAKNWGLNYGNVLMRWEFIGEIADKTKQSVKSNF